MGEGRGVGGPVDVEGKVVMAAHHRSDRAGRELGVDPVDGVAEGGFGQGVYQPSDRHHPIGELSHLGVGSALGPHELVDDQHLAEPITQLSTVTCRVEDHICNLDRGGDGDPNLRVE